jgi:hypothetical protein
MKYLVVPLLVFAGWAAQMPAAEAQSGIEGEITISPAHGGPSRVGVPDSTPLANTQFVVENESGTVAEFTTDDAGRFHVSLPPGHYTVSLKSRKPALGKYGPFEVDVAAGQTSKVRWNCDSGMR